MRFIMTAVRRQVLPATAVLLLAATLGGCAPATTAPKTEPPRAGDSPASVNRLTPIATAPEPFREPRIRVGLLSDEATAQFRRNEGGYVLVTDAGPYQIGRGFTLHAPLRESEVRYAVQVSAVSDQSSAQGLADRIARDTGARADLLFDAGPSLYKVLAGEFPTSEAAEPFRNDLVRRGYGSDMMIVKRPSDAPFEQKVRLVDDEGNEYTFDSRSVLVLPKDPKEFVRISGQPYRGGARTWINRRGLFNVINELWLEDYVKGVVPNEMGPTIYDEIEALKAQAMAARTYAVKRLGDFSAEGYDICATPACQVYKGQGTEHPLSNRAVEETAGRIIVHQGKPIDALYSATCGGETSDVGTMFPGRNEPYLRHVRCVEGELHTLTSARETSAGLLSASELHASIFASLADLPATGSWTAADVAASVGKAARLAGLTIDSSLRPASSRRGDVLRYLGRTLGATEGGKVVTLPEDRRYFFPNRPDDNDLQQAAAFLIKFQIVPMQQIDRLDLDQPMPRTELYGLLYTWLRRGEKLVESKGRVARIDGRTVGLKAEGKVTNHQLPDGVLLFRELGDRYQPYSNLPIVIGDRATLVRDLSKRSVALVVQANYDGVAYDRTSAYASWVRSYREDELVKMIVRRHPIRDLEGLEPLVVDEAERIAEMKVLADGGSFVLKGLPVRWSLGVPDNLFVFQKTKDPDGVDRYTFWGKGWGHGTGFCQVGGFGMAFAGKKAEEIVRHYYTGVEIVPIETVLRGR